MQKALKADRVRVRVRVRARARVRVRARARGKERAAEAALSMKPTMLRTSLDDDIYPATIVLLFFAAI